jgi:hypothetical protein
VRSAAVQGISQSNNYTAAFAAVPCPDVPEAHAAAAAADARTGHASSPPPFTTQRTFSWTPGIPAGARSCMSSALYTWSEGISVDWR